MFHESGGYPSDNSSFSASQPLDNSSSGSNDTMTTAPTNPDTGSSDSDVSRNTIVILVVLTLIISILGTWTVLNEAGTMHIATKAPGPTQAQVKLNIMSEQDYLASQKPAQGLATGNVALNIIK